MKSEYDKRLKAIKTLLRKESSLLERGQSDAHRARRSLTVARDALDEVQQEIDRGEDRLRSRLNGDQVLSVEQLEREGAYLEHQRRLEVDKRGEHEQATGEVAAATKRVQEQYLKVKGLQEASERVVEQLRREDEKESFREADDLWMQRNRKKS